MSVTVPTSTSKPYAKPSTGQVAATSPEADHLFRISVDQYHRMIQSNILGEEDHVELVEGLLLRKMSKKSPHRIALARAVRVINALLPPGWSVQSQDPITLADGEPEADACIIRGIAEDYPDAHPGPRDVALAIEVSDSTLAQDRGPKLRSYARAGIETYWIVNLESRTIELYDLPDPTTSTYKRTTLYDLTTSIPLTLAGQVVAHVHVRDILP
jgi:Uma2 family endonuclease